MFWGNFFCAATNTDNTKRNQPPKDHRSDDEQLLSTKKITAWNKKQNVAWEKAYHKSRLRLLFCPDIASFNSVFSLSSFCISFSGSQRPIGSESRLFTGDDSEDKSLLSLSLSFFLIGRIDRPDIWRPHTTLLIKLSYEENNNTRAQKMKLWPVFFFFFFLKFYLY